MIVLDSGRLKDLDVPEIVSLSFMSDYVNTHPDKVKALLSKHDEAPSNDDSVNLLKIAALSGARGRYFDEDLIASSAEAYNFNPAAIGLAVNVVKNLFGKKTDSVAPAVQNVSKDAVPEEKKKIGDKIKGFFGKIFGKEGDGDLSGANARNLAETVKDEKDKDKDKKILGMKPGLFWGLLAGLIVLIIILVVVAIRAKNKKKQIDNKKD